MTSVQYATPTFIFLAKPIAPTGSAVRPYVFNARSSCILQVWDYGAALQPCKCPLCRREITLLVPSEDSSRRRHRDDVAEILQRIERYNRLYGERSNGLFQMIVSAIYVISPVDIIPEGTSLLGYSLRNCVRWFSLFGLTLTLLISRFTGLLGIIGFLDDLIIIFICFLYVAALYRAVLLSRHGGSR
ncbi:hypothetical protein DH2020_035138 [Rehmannia glutinosa]|uniref:RING-type E3 ubiquitin transferase n=1 Tax=Rehmannia glutinosa TaxID=99300 RepID=A0ABR0V970_REHGL